MADHDHGRPGESFLARRARLKYDRQHGKGDDEPPPRPAIDPPAERPGSPATAPPRRATVDADLPAVDTLADDDDFSGYLADGISEGLRRAALRKLFHLPHFNVICDLDDYAEDYTTFEPLGDLVTAHQRALQAGAEARQTAADTEAAAAPAPEAATDAQDAAALPVADEASADAAAQQEALPDGSGEAARPEAPDGPGGVPDSHS